MKIYPVIVVLALSALPIFAQQGIHGYIGYGPTVPGTCTPGTAPTVWFDSDATAGANWFGCTSTNTWTLLGNDTHASTHAENAADEILLENLGTACADGQIGKANATGGVICAADAGGTGADSIHALTTFQVLGTSSTVLTLGTGCSATSPCNAQIGNKIITLQNSCTATMTGSESGAWGWEVSAANSNVAFWHNITGTLITVAGTGCVEVTAQSAFAADNLALFSDTITTGAYDFSDLSDKRGLGREVVIAGAGVTITTGADGRKTAALDTTAGPVITGDWDFGGGGIEVENGTTPPACTEGQLFVDTDATSGSRLMACETTTFVTQGGGGSTYELVNATNGEMFNPYWQDIAGGNANNTTQTAQNTSRLWMFSVPGGNNVVTTNIIFRVGTADAAATAELAVYNGACDTIVAQTGATGTGLDTTGVKTRAWSGGAKTLTPGVYFIAWTSNSATLAMDAWLLIDQWPTMKNTSVVRAGTGTATTGGAVNATCGSRSADNSMDPIRVMFE